MTTEHIPLCPWSLHFQGPWGNRFGVQADKDAAPAQQAIDGPPERLMIENGKPQANPRFAAEEKALEEQLLREEEEEIARERYDCTYLPFLQRRFSP